MSIYDKTENTLLQKEEQIVKHRRVRCFFVF